MSAAASPVLDIVDVTATHGRGSGARRTLAPTSLRVDRGESVAVVGASGAGKSTLADIVLGLRPPADGHVSVRGETWCTDRTAPSRRERHIVQGVPQDPSAAFVPRWTLRTSIVHAVRALTDHTDVDERIDAAATLAELDPALLDRRLSEVSGGQAQRAAIARALAVGPAVVVADEPTSALDPETAVQVSTALLGLARTTGIALLLVTHDPALAARCDRTVTITAPHAA
ncbi:ATP-binding cassette domain-containing protein [Pseudoclavibacter chungangensis]|uniref:ATP-binding cassette domain-containing protein n=1 Tax=Pseudoclavibacter chungangensis TaxID=587635 RepID=A0A7J5BQ44_9MICO|nr:ATP-binding cassette domain-containing protein [Pseudoclavibacter chungangensis]KAB1654785.1 ATP-binding cassette domain-containing protein [Pseudoclavibacter chungangensis]NYJ68105.1 peptide/nickel transport system ATP-binding protein [Pseudoclavibacter chungangensis]